VFKLPSLNENLNISILKIKKLMRNRLPVSLGKLILENSKFRIYSRLDTVKNVEFPRKVLLGWWFYT